MIICIVGPTGVGKTKLSIELAKKLNGEIINADSTQVYRGMDTSGTPVAYDTGMSVKVWKASICGEGGMTAGKVAEGERLRKEKLRTVSCSVRETIKTLV